MARVSVAGCRRVSAGAFYASISNSDVWDREWLLVESGGRSPGSNASGTPSNKAARSPSRLEEPTVAAVHQLSNKASTYEAGRVGTMCVPFHPPAAADVTFPPVDLTILPA